MAIVPFSKLGRCQGVDRTGRHEEKRGVGGSQSTKKCFGEYADVEEFSRSFATLTVQRPPLNETSHQASADADTLLRAKNSLGSAQLDSHKNIQWKERIRRRIFHERIQIVEKFMKILSIQKMFPLETIVEMFMPSLNNVTLVDIREEDAS
uniref:Uncharacterized protein n=1 Tax=Vespula pensylvanica TaxID=30213 RepID=A0A834JL35_VESPE|nr:hypothetical protein H0235_017648 [Vespula pensylvanica]